MKKILLVLSFLVVSLFAKIDINTASIEEFAMIKGIGLKKAEAIVKYRKEHGKFKNIDELMKVKGIGKAIVENVKNDVKNKKASKKTTKTDKKVKKNTTKKTQDKKKQKVDTKKTKKSSTSK